MYNPFSRLPRYYLAHNSYWLDELVALYEDADIAGHDVDEVGPPALQALLEKALDRDWMRADEFRSRFQLRASEVHFFERHHSDSGGGKVVEDVPVPELRINGDATLNLAFPTRVLQEYGHLFRAAFILRRARHLLVQ